MNMFKKNGGFTLVELIVVIAILAILAGVAVPMYSGYINKANEASDMTQLDSLKTAAVFAVMEDHAAADITKITYDVTNGKVTVAFTCPDTECASVTSADVETDVENLMGGDLPAMKSGATKAELDLGDAVTTPKWVLSK